MDHFEWIIFEQFLEHFMELTLVENEVLDLSDQQLLRFGERFHFEIDVFGAFESTFLLFLFEHRMTLFRFSYHRTK